MRALCAMIVVLAACLSACAQAPPKPRFEDAFVALPATAQTMPGGVAYVDLEVGHGEMPASIHDVTVDYSVWLENGTFVDSSATRAPMTFTYATSQMVRGFEDGLATMRVGGRRRFRVPAALAYPRDGAPGVPARSALVFDVRLLNVVPADLGSDGGNR